jgi:hypothetical protein
VPWFFTRVENCWPWLAQRALLRQLSLAVELALAFRQACHDTCHLDKFFTDFVSSETFSALKNTVAAEKAKAEEAWLNTQVNSPLILR